MAEEKHPGWALSAWATWARRWPCGLSTSPDGLLVFDLRHEAATPFGEVGSLAAVSVGDVAADLSARRKMFGVSR